MLERCDRTHCSCYDCFAHSFPECPRWWTSTLNIQVSNWLLLTRAVVPQVVLRGSELHFMLPSARPSAFRCQRVGTVSHSLGKLSVAYESLGCGELVLQSRSSTEGSTNMSRGLPEALRHCFALMSMNVNSSVVFMLHGSFFGKGCDIHRLTCVCAWWTKELWRWWSIANRKIVSSLP